VQNQKHVIRSSVVFLMLIICFFIFSIKLVLIQVFRSSHLANLADKQHKNVVAIEPIRGNIYDRKLRLMAFNVYVNSLFANPRYMSEKNKERAIEELPLLLKIDPERIQKKLNKSKYFVWLKRKLSAEVVKTIKSLKIKGLGFRKESKRYYPNGKLAAHILGFVGIDNRGLDAIEAYYNEKLSGKPGRELIFQDARHQELMTGDNIILPKDGAELVLTIDETIQYISERSLDKAFKKHNAKGASIIVMNVKTGEILALANRPTYNLQKVSKSSIESRTNRSIHYAYEPGSVFKIFTAAAALEENLYMEEDKIFCENGKYKVANNILHDHHPYGFLSFKDVITFSSNIGVTKIAQKLGAETVYKYVKRFRFGMKTEIDLGGEISGFIRKPSSWSRTSIGAIPIGHEVLVTPLQLVAAVSAVANNGVYMRPFIVKYIQDKQSQILRSFKPQIVDKVISSDTSRRIRDILENVVEKGTGRNAAIKGVRVAGKTGTAQKVIDGTYSHSKFCSSFLGFAPVDDPQIAVIVVFDEPHPAYYGGTVAAPVFKEVVENTLRYLHSSRK